MELFTQYPNGWIPTLTDRERMAIKKINPPTLSLLKVGGGYEQVHDASAVKRHSRNDHVDHQDKKDKEQFRHGFALL